MSQQQQQPNINNNMMADQMMGGQMNQQMNMNRSPQMRNNLNNTNSQMQNSQQMMQGQQNGLNHNRRTPQKTIKDIISESLQPDFISDFTKLLNENDNITSEAKSSLNDHIKILITNTSQYAIFMAKKRNSDSVELNDMKYAIYMNFLHPNKKHDQKIPTQQHVDNMDLLEEFRRKKRDGMNS